MTAKYFGQFLIEKGVISEDSLVEALLEQVSTLPPLSKIAYEEKLLNAKQMLKVFQYQHEDHLEFFSACNKEGLVDEAFVASIQKRTNALRTPLGEILVQKSFLSLKDLTRMLDEFLSQAEPNKVVEKAIVPPAAVNSNPLKNESSTVIGEDLIQELGTRLSKEKKENLLNYCTIIGTMEPNSKDLYKLMLQELYKEIHQFTGYFKLSNQNQLLEFTQSMESQVSAFLGIDAQPEASKLSNFAQSIVDFVNCIWDFGQSLIETKSEEKVLNSENLSRLNTVKNSIKGLS